MPDIAVSLIIILLVGLSIAAVLFYVSKKKRNRLMEIERYCQERGYLCSRNDSGLEHILEIKGEGFSLKSIEKSQYHDAQTGSDSWQREIQWRSGLGGNDAFSFVMGTVRSSLSWDRLPEMMQAAMIQKLGLTDSSGVDQGTAEAIKIKSGTLLLLRRSGQVPKERIEEIADELSGWPSIQGLTMEADGNQLIVRLSNARLSSSSEIERFIRLGQIIWGKETLRRKH